MLMIFLLKMIVLAFALYVVITFTLAIIAVKGLQMRALFSLTAILAPFLFAWSFVCLICGKRQPIKPFDAELGRTEDEIEAARVRIFGVTPLQPSFSHVWQMTYRNMLEQAYQKSVKLRSFAATAAHSHRVA